MVDIQHTALTGSGQLHPPLSKTFTGAPASYTPDNADELVVKTDVTPHILYRTTGVTAGDVTQIGTFIIDDISDVDTTTSPPSDGEVLTWVAANSAWEPGAGGGLSNVVDDLTPQLGGDLDVNGQSIVSAAAGNIAITPDTTGSVVIDGLNWPQADGTNGQVLTTDGLGQLSFSAGGGGASVQVQYEYDNTTTSGDPGAGNFRLNNATIASATNLFVSQETKAGADLSALLDALEADDKIYIQNIEDATERLLLDITSVTDNTTWYDIVFTVDDSNGPTWTDGNEFGFILIFSANTAGGLNNVVEDLTPQLGGDLDVNGQSIVSVAAGNIAITPDTTGTVVLDGLNWPQTDGTNGQILQTNGSGDLSFVTPGAGSSLNINYEFQYDNTTTSGDPGSGGFRLNNATVASATSLFISQTNAAGADLSTIFDALDSGDKIYLQNNADSTERILLDITSVTDNTTWYDITVTVDDSNGPTWTNAADFGLIFEHTAEGSGGGGGTVTLFGEEKLSTVTTAASQATVTFSSINQTYNDLIIRWRGSSDGAVDSTTLDIEINDDATASNYFRQVIQGSNGASSAPEASDMAVSVIGGANSVDDSYGEILLARYTETTHFKILQAEATNYRSNGNSMIHMLRGMFWEDTSAITKIDLTLGSGNFADGSVFELYGRKEFTLTTP